MVKLICVLILLGLTGCGENENSRIYPQWNEGFKTCEASPLVDPVIQFCLNGPVGQRLATATEAQAWLEQCFQDQYFLTHGQMSHIVLDYEIASRTDLRFRYLDGGRICSVQYFRF